MFEYMFGIDNIVPIDLWIDFGAIIIITRLFYRADFFGSHNFPCPSLLLRTTVLNNIHETVAPQSLLNRPLVY